MSIKWMEGFEQFANLSGSTAVRDALQTAGYTVSSNGTDSILVSPGRVANAYALRLSQAPSNARSASFQRTFESESDLVSIGFAYMATERSPIVQIGSLPVLEWPVGCRLNGVDGEAIPIRNIWYYYELVIDKQAEEMRLYINNRLDITAPLPAEAQNMTTYQVKFGSSITSSTATTQFIDDLMFIDGEGDGITDRIGPIEITTRFPTADVTTDWEPSIEGQPLYTMVNQRPPQAGRYIQANVSGQEATFTSSQELPTDSQIFAIGLVARALKTDIDNRQLGLIWGEGDNRLEFIDTSLSTENEYSYAFFEKPAPGQNWTKELVEQEPFGVKVRP